MGWVVESSFDLPDTDTGVCSCVGVLQPILVKFYEASSAIWRGKLQNAKNDPPDPGPGPARDAQVAQLKNEIAAASSISSSDTSQNSADSTSTDNPTANSSSSSLTSSAKSVKLKLGGEVKKLAEQLASDA